MHFQLSDSVLDIVQNAVEASAKLVMIDYIDTRDAVNGQNEPRLRVCVGDDGKGMDEETLKRALDPFYTDGVKHRERKIGLGLPFLRQMVEQCGGRFEVESKSGEGTSLFFEIDPGHVDAPPEGDVTALFVDCLLLAGSHEMAIHRFHGDKRYTLMRGELREALGSLDDAEAIRLLGEYIRGQEEEIY